MGNIKPIFIEQFLPEELCSFLYSYCVLKYSNPKKIKMDTSTASLIGVYSDPAMETLLASSTSVIENNVGKKLWPANSFLRIYDKGSDLKSHTDRPSCEYTVALCLGGDPIDKPYSLYIGTEDKDSKYKYFDELDNYIGLNIDYEFPMVKNNALVFQGLDVPHWREYCTHDHFITVFLHYVEQDGKFKHLKFDGREMLSLPKK